MMTPAPIVVAESQGQIGFLFSFLILVFAVALARGVAGAHTTAGAAAAAVFCGAFIVSVLVGWIVMIRRPARLEIAADAIRFVQRNGQASALSRQQGDELRFVRQHRGALSQVWTLGLAIAGTDTVITLPGLFSRNAVRQACCARGWRFANEDSWPSASLRLRWQPTGLAYNIRPRSRPLSGPRSSSQLREAAAK